MNMLAAMQRVQEGIEELRQSQRELAERLEVIEQRIEQREARRAATVPEGDEAREPGVPFDPETTEEEAIAEFEGEDLNGQESDA